jgi:RNA polymerase sigma-70 factor (ECF subfamily)
VSVIVDFDSVWKTYELELTNFVSSKLYDKFSISDVMQEIAIKIYKNIDSLSTIKNLRAWIYRVARNTLIDFYKQNSKTIPDELYNLEFTTQKPLEENDLIKCIEYISNELKQSDKKILDLSIKQQYSINEIAEQLQLSKDGTKSKLKRAKQKVADRFFTCCNVEKDIFNKIVDMKPIRDNKCEC